MAEFENELRTLFKYRTLAGEFGRQAAEDAILHNRLFWQTPTAFNDPFDCNPALIFGLTPNDRRKYIRDAATRVMVKQKRWQRRKVRREIVTEPITSVEDRLRIGFRDWMGESAVSCFSLVRDSPLMWAHYANDHKGICLIFEEQLKPVTFISLEVAYAEERPLVDLTRVRDLTVYKQAVLTKARYWSYEQETRMIDYRVGAGLRDFPSTVLKGVILGARISPEDADFVAGLVSRRPVPMSIYRAEIDRQAFALSIMPIQQPPD